MERKLLLQERMSLRMHLMMCSGCTNFRRQMNTMRSAMQHYASGATVSTSDDPDSER
ncbi:MAG: hypothetical protein ABI343_21050 [Burkholderiaceae bacterium]